MRSVSIVSLPYHYHRKYLMGIFEVLEVCMALNGFGSYLSQMLMDFAYVRLISKYTIWGQIHPHIIWVYNKCMMLAVHLCLKHYSTCYLGTVKNRKTRKFCQDPSRNRKRPRNRPREIPTRHAPLPPPRVSSQSAMKRRTSSHRNGQTTTTTDYAGTEPLTIAHCPHCARHLVKGVNRAP